MTKRLLLIVIILFSALLASCASVFSGPPLASDNATIGEGASANTVNSTR